MSTDPLLGTISIFDIAADAEDSNRGFVVQYLDTVREWLSAIGSNKTIYCEVHEDVSIVDPDLNSRRFRQIKSYLSTDLGFNDKAVKHSVYLFYRNAVRLIESGQGIDGCSYELSIHGKIRKRDAVLKSWAEVGRPPSVENGIEALKNCVIDRLVFRYEEKSKALRDKADKGDAEAASELAALDTAYRAENERFESTFPWDTFVNCVHFQASTESLDARHRELVKFVEDGKFTLVPANIVIARCFQAVALRACMPNPEDRKLTQQDLEAILTEDERQMMENLQSDERVGLRILNELMRSSAAMQRLQSEVQIVVAKVQGIEDNTRLLPGVAGQITSISNKLDAAFDLASYRNSPTRADLSFPLIAQVLERIEKYLQGEEQWEVDPNDDSLDPPDDLQEKLEANELLDAEEVIEVLRDAFTDFNQIQAYLRRNLPAPRQRAIFAAMKRLYRKHKERGLSSQQIFDRLIEDITPADANEEHALACEVFVAYLFHACEVFKRARPREV